MFSTSDPIISAILALALVGYMVYRLFTQQMVTQRGLLLPVIVALYLGASYVTWSDPIVAGAVAGGTLLGLAVGAGSGQLVRVWRGEDGQVYQRGSWRYAGVLLALLAIRVALRVFMHGSHGSIALALGDASIAMAVGLYLGRTLSVGMRALGLVGWQVNALPRKAQR